MAEVLLEATQVWELFSGGTTQAEARAGAGEDPVSTEDHLDSLLAIGQLDFTDPKQCTLALLEFDIPGLDVVNEATLSLYFYQVTADVVVEAYAFDWGDGDPGPEDWRDPAWLSTATLLASRTVLEADQFPEEYLDFTSEAALNAAIESSAISGVMRFVVALNSHRLDQDVFLDRVLVNEDGLNATLLLDYEPAILVPGAPATAPAVALAATIATTRVVTIAGETATATAEALRMLSYTRAYLKAGSSSSRRPPNRGSATAP